MLVLNPRTPGSHLAVSRRTTKYIEPERAASLEVTKIGTFE